MAPTNQGSSIQERARTGSLVDPQEAMFDKEFNDADLEAALELRESRREARLEAQRDFKAADGTAKRLLAGFELAVGEQARCGRFKIKKTRTAAKEVSFETAPSERLTIGTEPSL